MDSTSKPTQYGCLDDYQSTCRKQAGILSPAGGITIPYVPMAIQTQKMVPPRDHLSPGG
tara:strand:+ start:304 stop:480 length:177 start_codon:yes stop_codon:yes gene_type:complete